MIIAQYTMKKESSYAVATVSSYVLTLSQACAWPIVRHSQIKDGPRVGSSKARVQRKEVGASNQKATKNDQEEREKTRRCGDGDDMEMDGDDEKTTEPGKSTPFA